MTGWAAQRDKERKQLRGFFGARWHGKPIGYLLKAEHVAAMADMRKAKAAARKAAKRPEPELLPMPEDWLTQPRETSQIRTTSDVLDQIVFDDMVDWPDAKVKEDVRRETIGRLVDSRLNDLHELLSERYDNDPKMLARIDRMILALIEVNDWKPAERAKRLVPWPPE